MSTRTSIEEGAQKQLDPEESVNEEEVDSPSNGLYSTIVKEGTQKQFDTEELDNKDEVNPPSDDSTITEEGGAQKQFSSEESDNEE